MNPAQALTHRGCDLFMRGRSIAQLTEAERDVLECSFTDYRRLGARTTLLERGQALNYSTMLTSGYMIRYLDDVEGLRQVVAFHVPGDFVDLHGYPLHVLDHSIGTISEADIALVPHTSIAQLVERDPVLGKKLWSATLIDSAIHREWLFRLGRLDAVGRVAHFFAETNARLHAVGLSDGASFALPLTQVDLSEIVGLTYVHVNRVLRALREDGVCVFRGGRVEIGQLAELEKLAQFDPTYLYLSDPPGARKVKGVH